jgi:hypothetical protein
MLAGGSLSPFSPMHRGQIILVRGCSGQYVSLGIAYFYPKASCFKPPAGFFLPLPPCLPQSDNCALYLTAVVCPPPFLLLLEAPSSASVFL